MANEAIQIGGALIGTQEIEGGPALAVAVCAGTVSTSGTSSITGAVTVSGTAAVAGAVTVSGTANVAVTSLPGVAGTVAVSSIPAVSGTVAVSSIPDVAGTVTVSSLPAVSGTVAVSGTATAALTYVPTTVTFYNVAIASADTQYAQALPATCKGLVFRCREATNVRYAFAPDIVASGTVSPFSTLKSGAEWAVMPMLLSGGTAYFAAGSAGVNIEMEAWA